MSNRIYLCGGDFRPGKRDACPNTLHDYPLPDGYVDAGEVAGRRLRKRWHSPRCPDCGLYGWRPGTLLGDESDQRVTANGVSDD